MTIILQVDTAYTFDKLALWTELAPGGTYRAFDWTISATALPPGMVNNGSDISGTPTTAGSYTFGMAKADGLGNPGPDQIIPVTVEGGTTGPPGPSGGALAARVAAFIGRAGDPETIAQADAHVPVVMAYVRAYTRDNGFYADTPVPNLEHVIVAAAARLVVNPEQAKRVQVADYTEQAATLEGFTLPELFVLNRYRRRTA